MEKKNSKLKIKKIFAILCIFLILQSYFSYFAQIVYAANDFLIQLSDEEDDGEIILDDETSDSVSEQIEEVMTTGEETKDEIKEEVEIENKEEQKEKIDEEVTEEQQEKVDDDIKDDSDDKTESKVEDGTKEDTQNVDKTEEPYIEPEVIVEVTSENSSIYKGYLYANSTSDLNYATNYNTIDKLTISGGKNITSLTIQDEPDKLVLITDTKVGLINQMYYRKARVSVDEFNKIFGEDGNITIYTPEGDVIGYINKDSEKINNDYVFAFPYQLNSVKFELTNIKEDGEISIKNDKSITETSEFSRNQISLFSAINTITSVNLYKGEEVKNYSAEGNINLEETESKMILELNKNELSTENKNELVLSVTLKTDEEKYDLFENPKIDIEFPSAIEDVEVTGMNLLYKNGLSVNSWEVKDNLFGKKVLELNLEGAQLEYMPGAVQQGTTLVVYTDVDVNRLTTDTSEAIKMTYSNKDTVRKSYILEGKDSEDVELNFVGRQELLRAMEIKSNENKVTSYDEETEKLQINPNEEQIVTVTGTVVNNYETTIQDVVIIGRIPFVGNKDENGNDLGTNFDTKLRESLITNGAIGDVYYSEDGEAEISSDSWTQDLEKIGEYKSYKIVIREKSLSKGEKISFEYNLNIPEKVGYNAIGYSNYTVYYKLDEQNYTNHCSCGIYTENKEVQLEDIKEGEKEEIAELTIGTQVSQCGRVLTEEDTVYERQVVKYTVVVRNTSNITATNVIIRGNAENANLYYFKTWLYENFVGAGEEWIGRYEEDINGEKQYEEFTIDSLAPGESKTFTYQVIAKELEEENINEIYGKISILADNIQKANLETIKNIIKEGKLETRVEYKGTEAAYSIDKSSNSGFYFRVLLKNISRNKLKDVVLNINMPDSIKFSEDSYIEGAEGLEKTVEKTANGTKLSIFVPEMSEEYEKYFYIPTTVKSFDTSLLSISFEITSNAVIDNEIYLSNDYSTTVSQSNSSYECIWTSDLEKETLDNGDIVSYIFKIKNTGVIDINYTSIEDMIPDGMEIEEITFNNGKESGYQFKNDEKVVAHFNIKVGEEVEAIIKAKVNEKLFKLDQSVIENKLKIDGGKYFEGFETDIISYKINNPFVTSEIKDEEILPNDNFYDSSKDTDINNEEIIEKNDDITEYTNEEITEQIVEQDNNESIEDYNNDSNDVIEQPERTIVTYSISGKVWFDKNKDGIKGAEESGKQSVVVYLFKATNDGGIDIASKLQNTVTDDNGEYVFKGVEEGNYIVVFDYATNLYNVTKYQVSTARSNENSDVVSKNLTLNGETSIYGLTDVLTVSNSSLINIDMGLIEKNEFDLSLEKKISEVTVKNDEGTKTYNYEDSTNAKLEIKSKYYKSTTLELTYKIIVKNEGEVPGYVNKIVDYMPEGMTIDFNNSPGWYQSQDGGLYYTGLVGKEITPGGTEEVILKLKKSLADGNAEKIVNSAEILEYTNAQGIEDKDSISNNKVEKEDDYGKSVLLVSISTGNTIQNILSILIVIIMVSVIIIMFVKFKNTKKIYR